MDSDWVAPMSNEYYTYVWCDPRIPGPVRFGRWVFPGEPFYIGKGKGNRAWSHSGNTHSANKIKKMAREGWSHTVVVKRDGLSEREALELEAKLILRIGRVDLGTGPLTNWHTSGADVRIKRKTHHSKACSKGQKERFRNESERVKTRDGFYNWFDANPERHEELARRRVATLRSDEVRSKTSASVLKMYKKNPSVIEAMKKGRAKAQKERDYYSQISRTLGGKEVEVNRNGKVRIFRSQRQAAFYLKCHPLVVNNVLHHKHGVFSESVQLRFLNT